MAEPEPVQPGKFAEHAEPGLWSHGDCNRPWYPHSSAGPPKQLDHTSRRGWLYAESPAAPPTNAVSIRRTAKRPAGTVVLMTCRSKHRYQRLRVDAGASDSPASSLGPSTAEKIRNSCKFGPALVVPNKGARSIPVWRVGLKAKLGPSSISSTRLPRVSLSV
jgi:hypothetical protein